MEIYFQKLRPDAVIPSRATKESVGFDLSVCCDEPVFGKADGKSQYGGKF